MDRVEWDITNREVLIEIVHRRNVATPVFEAHLDVELSSRGQIGDGNLRVQNLHLGVHLDVLRLDLAFAGGLEINGLGAGCMQLKGHLFQIQNNAGGILQGARNRRELVQHPLDLDRGNRRSLDGGQQDSTKGVTHRRSETPLDRLGVETTITIGRDLAICFKPLGLLKSLPKNSVNPPLNYFE